MESEGMEVKELKSREGTSGVEATGSHSSGKSQQEKEKDRKYSINSATTHTSAIPEDRIEDQAGRWMGGLHGCVGGWVVDGFQP